MLILLLVTILGFLLACSASSCIEDRFRKVLVVTYSDREEEFENLASKINEAYCSRHGYEYLRMKTSRFDSLPPWWRKVFIIQDLMKNSKDRYDYIMWVDSDAAFAKDAPPIHKLFARPRRNGKIFFVGDDISLKIYGYGSRQGTSNAGVFAVSNTPEGRKFMEEWANMFDPSKWCLASDESCNKANTFGKWKTDGSWSHETFEQGTLNALIFKKPHLIESFHESIMSNPGGCKYVNHMWAMSSDERRQFFEKELAIYK